jgi:hypothetical protein
VWPTSRQSVLHHSVWQLPRRVSTLHGEATAQHGDVGVTESGPNGPQFLGVTAEGIAPKSRPQSQVAPSAAGTESVRRTSVHAWRHDCYSARPTMHVDRLAEAPIFPNSVSLLPPYSASMEQCHNHSPAYLNPRGSPTQGFHPYIIRPPLVTAGSQASITASEYGDPRQRHSIDRLCVGMTNATLQPPSSRSAETEVIEPTVAELAVIPRGPVRGSQRRLKIGNWSDHALKSAIAAMEAGGRVKIVARYFDIPPSSLTDHLHGRTLSRKRRPPTILKADEEDALIEYITKM